MAVADLTQETLTIGGDSGVVVDALAEVNGGRTLDTSSVPDLTMFKAGHIVYKNSDGEYLPLGVSGEAYSYSAGQNLVGVLKHNTLASDPRAAIVTIGTVCEARSPYTLTDTIKAALPRISFI